MQIYFDNRIDHYKKIFPSISFPVSGPSVDFLVTNNAYKVNTFVPYDSTTQKLESCDPYIQDGFCFVVRAVDKTAEELAADVAVKAAQMRAARDAALKASDWTQVADAPVDKTAWATYRQALRDLPSAEGWPNVELPNDPNYVAPSV